MANEIMSVEGQLVGMPLAGPESFSQQQLDYLKRALGVDETVLFSNQASSTAQIALSEAASNFEYIEVYASWTYNGSQRLTAYTKIHGSTDTFNLGGVGVGSRSGTGVGYFYCIVDYSISGSTITVNKAIRALNDGSLTSTTDSLKVVKIVGIHRIAGGN